MTSYSKNRFAVCPLCGATAVTHQGKVVTDTYTGADRRITRWTRCEVCMRRSRQKYNTHLHRFLEPDYVWAIP